MTLDVLMSRFGSKFTKKNDYRADFSEFLRMDPL